MSRTRFALALAAAVCLPMPVPRRCLAAPALRSLHVKIRTASIRPGHKPTIASIEAWVSGSKLRAEVDGRFVQIVDGRRLLRLDTQNPAKPGAAAPLPAVRRFHSVPEALAHDPDLLTATPSFLDRRNWIPKNRIGAGTFMGYSTVIYRTSGRIPGTRGPAADALIRARVEVTYDLGVPVALRTSTKSASGRYSQTAEVTLLEINKPVPHGSFNMPGR